MAMNVFLDQRDELLYLYCEMASSSRLCSRQAMSSGFEIPRLGK